MVFTDIEFTTRITLKQSLDRGYTLILPV